MSTSGIFHEYDIRGRYPEDLNESVFYRLAEAISLVLKSKKVALGRDSRLSSETLFLYLAMGFKKRGIQVTDLGLASTPFCFWYSQKFRTDTLVITASHNPPHQNGLKIYSFKTGPVDKKNGLLKIKQKFEAQKFQPEIIDLKESRFSRPNDAAADYQKFILSLVSSKISPRLKLAIDFSNGPSAREIGPVLEKLKIKFTTLNEKPDGRFPGHSPNPLDEASQRPIRFLIKQQKFELGVLLDGDGDRVVFFDETGEVIDPNYAAGALVENYFSRVKEKLVMVRTVSLSRLFDEVAGRRGIKVFVSRVGRSCVHHLAKIKKAFFAFEKSGHYFFKESYYGESSLLVMLRLLEIMSKTQKPISKLVLPFKDYIIWPEINVPFQGQAGEIIKNLKEKFTGGKASTLDGLRVDYPDWAFNVRKSNNDNLWRLSLEGKNEDELEKHRKEIESILNA